MQGLGTAGGFKFVVQDRAARGDNALQDATDELIARTYQTPELFGVFTTFRASTPQLYADVDRVKANMMNVPLSNIFEALQVNLGSAYVNDFNSFGRTFQVRAQAEGNYRRSEDDIRLLKTRNRFGADGAARFGAQHPVEERPRSRRPLQHVSRPPKCRATPPPVTAPARRWRAIERLAAEVLPPGMTIEWTDLAYQEKLAGNTAIYIFPLCVLFVFLVHSAEYESWSLPLAIILIAPICIPFALAGVFFRGMDNNLITQIGFVVLVGLAAKNAVLIVEFAKQLEDEGLDRFAAAVEACRLRLRPILMTSFAFILGVLPLAMRLAPAPKCDRCLARPCSSACSASRFSACSSRRRSTSAYAESAHGSDRLEIYRKQNAPTSSERMAATKQYIPGVCNIGRAEIRQRQLIGWVALAATVGFWIAFAVIPVPAPWRLLLFFPASLAATGFLQAAWHFCAKFGLRGVFNFGPNAGQTDTVEQAEFRRQDRRTALKIIALSALAGAVVAAVAYFLPVLNSTLVARGTVHPRNRHTDLPQVGQQERAVVDDVVQHEAADHGVTRHREERLSLHQQRPRLEELFVRRPFDGGPCATRDLLVELREHLFFARAASACGTDRCRAGECPKHRR